MTKAIRLACLWWIPLLVGCQESAGYRLVMHLPPELARDGTYLLEVFSIVPVQGADCGSLLSGNTLPGEAGYTVESEESLSISPKSASVLKGVGRGSRLFYGELSRAGEDTVVLRGCIRVRAGDVEQVEMQLLPVCALGQSAAERCDGLDNDCDGQIDEGDPEGLCPPVPHSRAMGCAAGTCQYTCDSGWKDANQAPVDGCECDEGARQVEVCDGLDNDCDGEVDGRRCMRCIGDEDCAKLDPCKTGVCVGGTCRLTALSDDAPCDDGAYCTVDDRCRAGGCAGSRRDCSALDAPCQRSTCDEAQNQCVQITLGSGATCSDGMYCTVGDRCDASGRCVGQSRDCSGLQDPCNQGICSEEEGRCSARPLADGAACSDSDICTQNDACLSGRCLGDALSGCSDLNPPLIAWNFNRDGDTEGWSAPRSLSGKVQGGNYGLAITGPNPYLLSPKAIHADAAFYSHVRVRLEGSLGDDQAQLYFTTEADGAPSATKSVDFIVRAGAAFTEYIVDMSINPAWKGAIQQIRFDPTKDGTSGGFKLDFVRLEGRMGFDDGAYYLLVAKHSDKCADAIKSSIADGSRVRQWQCTGQTNQQWKLQVAEDGYYWITNRNAGRVLEVAAMSLANGADAQLWTPGPLDNQRWKLVPTDPGFFKIQCKHSGKLFAVAGHSHDDGANTCQWEDSTTQSQQWSLRRVQ